MSKSKPTNQPDWQPVRPEISNGISGKLLVAAPMKTVLTKVEPGGVFQLHRDHYGHLFHILSGEGRFTVEGEDYHLTAGMSLQIQAGALHGYENCGEEELLLISVNRPVEHL